MRALQFEFVILTNFAIAQIKILVKTEMFNDAKNHRFVKVRAATTTTHTHTYIYVYTAWPFYKYTAVKIDTQMVEFNISYIYRSNNDS